MSEPATRTPTLEDDLAEAELLLGALTPAERAEAEGLIKTVRNRRSGGASVIKAKGRLGVMGLIPDRSDPDYKPPGEAIPQGLPPFRNGLKVVGGTRKEEPKKRRLVMVKLSDIKPEEVNWLWHGRFAVGRGNIVVGDGGVGKSTFTSFLAAVVTSGGCWPDRPLQPVGRGSVVFLTDEEESASDLRPKIDAFGGDSDKVQVVSMIRDEHDQECQFNLSRDVPLLEEEVARIGDVRLIVVDPIGAYFEGKESYNDPEVRARLRPLFQLARKLRIAVLLVMHLTKNQEKDILYRVSGSAAFVNNCRMAWFYSEDPEDEKGRRLLTFLKGNPKGKVTTGLAVSFPGEEKLAWDSRPVLMTAKQVGRLLNQRPNERDGAAGARGPVPNKTAPAMALILEALKTGPAPQPVVLKAVTDAGVKKATFYKALKRLLARTKEVVRTPAEGETPPLLRLAPPPEVQGELDLPAPQTAPEESPA